MEVYEFLPKVRGGAQRAEGSVVEGKLLYYCLEFYTAKRVCRNFAFWSEPQKLVKKLLGFIMYIHHSLEEEKGGLPTWRALKNARRSPAGVFFALRNARRGPAGIFLALRNAGDWVAGIFWHSEMLATESRAFFGTQKCWRLSRGHLLFKNNIHITILSGMWIHKVCCFKVYRTAIIKNVGVSKLAHPLFYSTNFKCSCASASRPNFWRARPIRRCASELSDLRSRDFWA